MGDLKMRFVVIFFLIFIGGSSMSLLHAKNIESIQFKGLKRTKTEIIKRFLDSEIGTPFDSITAARDAQALLNLRIFSNVTYRFESMDSIATLVFQCDELITLLPTFSFGTLGNNTFVKFGGFNANLFGKVGMLKMYYQYYDGHSVFVENEIPYINNSPFGLRFDIRRIARLEPIRIEDVYLDYKYRSNVFGLDGFYEFKQNHRLYVGGTYFTEYFDRKQNPESDSTRFVEGMKIRVNVEHKIQKMNFIGCLENGVSNETKVSYTYVNGEQPFFQITNDLKYVQQIGTNGNFGTRLKFGSCTDNMSAFAPFALDSYLSIRGIGNRVDRGITQLVLNTEYRHRIINNRHGSIQLVGFIDSGTWRSSGERYGDLADQMNIKVYGGVGGRLFLTRFYKLIVRVDMGFNLEHPTHRGIVVGLGQYF